MSEHNHVTTVVKPEGQCPACDEIPRCDVIIGQQTGIGPGLFIACKNLRPCPDHPRHIDGQADG